MTHKSIHLIHQLRAIDVLPNDYIMKIMIVVVIWIDIRVEVQAFSSNMNLKLNHLVKVKILEMDGQWTYGFMLCIAVG